MTLTSAQIQIIKDTIPALKKSGTLITKTMYQYMFDTHPEVVPLFNQQHQKTLAQPNILAFSLLKYAENIEDLAPIKTFVNQIVEKHVGLRILPEHYPIVGASILHTLKTLLGDGATEEFLAAWGAAYGDLAQILIDAEANVYKQTSEKIGGWEGFRDFSIEKVKVECSDVHSLYLKPTNGKPVSIPLPGQYITVKAIIDGAEQRRQYSVSQTVNKTDKSYRISVRLILGGVMSTYLHTLNAGDKLEILPPCGPFIYDKESANENIVLIGGGIGITPLISISEAAIAQNKYITFLGSYRSPATHPFSDWLKSKTSTNFKSLLFYSKTDEGNTFDISKKGRITKDDLALIENLESSDIYLLGPESFMMDMKKYLIELGVNSDVIKFETFAPAVPALLG